MRPPARLVAALALAAVVAVTGAACGTTSPPAATVNGQEISQAELFDQLEALRSSGDAALAEGRTDDPAAFFATTPRLDPGVYLASISSQALTQLIALRVIEQEAAARNLALAPLELGTSIVDRYERAGMALGRSELGLAPTASTGEVEAAIAADLSAVDPLYVPICVSVIAAPAEVIAEAAARLAAGDEFAAVAADLSQLASAPNGGDEGCILPAQVAANAPEVAEVLLGMQDGDVSEEILDAIVLRRGVDVTGTGETFVQRAFQTWFDRVAPSMDVEVLPKYGMWNPSLRSVVPPF